MSRTCARQQRMRQQTLNEERMSHADQAARPSGERRSSGSKLIISSPTPSVYPFMNHAASVSQSSPLSDSNPARNPNQPTRSVGASALLAFLSGSDHRASSQAANTNASQSSQQPQQRQQQQQQSSPHSAQEKTVNPQHPSSVLVSTRPGQLNGNAVPVVTSVSTLPPGCSSTAVAAAANSAHYSNATLSTHTDDEVVDQSPSQSHESSGILLNSVCPNSDETGSNPTRNSDSGLQHANNFLPVDISTMDLESTVSPASSDLNSPMESCFPNIAEDQESDSFDLNNITPSIHLSSSFVYHCFRLLFGTTHVTWLSHFEAAPPSRRTVRCGLQTQSFGVVRDSLGANSTGVDYAKESI
ncbi:unnamed protein product [Echinostoma caproni]|uniref:TORC_M domain-containing protein n=1 Tax=Echinostoma caproni TaxID=27848 RepID=A0A183AXP5_9TREM|nr:unnamed protein product [Echinostoma caproni]